MAFILVGIYKRFVYVSPDESDVPMNAYVGGDAYNYIINGTHTIAYFVLALLCALVASTILISNHLYALKAAIQEGKNG
ncbi:hypothetical protein [Geomicrobium sp. JCM 19039]|uniref:hypothetical protein n=1 Tax=Geomicrobium sp. JCM 19039 TaxID=1460636 RepID=UPI00045F447A|nr:hypothetical protein [Geomicrobium sp. JCM 19039]GAK12382.1 hypothetical protein JCM19039_2151 [Geomicrobium sp. JCM 19039]